MGRFHVHSDGTRHAHPDEDKHHEHGHGPRDVGDHSGYAETGTVRIEILENLLSENDRVADENRARLIRSGVRAVNLMSSPGAGKTTLLTQTLRRIGQDFR